MFDRSLSRATVAACLLVSVLAFAGRAKGAAATATSDADEAARPRPLFERAGGTYAFARVVDEFVEALVLDPAFKANAAVRKGLGPARKAGVKFQITSLLCQEAGGPCKYEGRSLRESHQNLAITAAQ